MLQQEDKESHTIENSIEGMTTDMIVKGRTLNNLYKVNAIKDNNENYLLVDTFEKDAPRDRVVYIVNNTDKILLLNVYKIGGGWDSNPIIRENSISKLDLTGKRLTGFLGMYDRGWKNSLSDKEELKNTCIVLDREETYIPQKYFEGIKSFGQEEAKIVELSHNKNFINLNEITTNHNSVTFKKESESIIIEGEANSINWGCVQFEQFLKKGTWIFSYQATGNGYLRALVYDAETLKSISSDIYPNRGREFTNDKDRKILIKLFLKGESADSKLINKYWDMQLEEGTQATTYESPKENRKDILLSELGFDEGLRGLSSTVCDELNSITDKAIKKIEKHSFTGNENLERQSINEHGIVNFLLRLSTVKGGIGISNKLKQQNTNIANTLDEGFYFSEGIGIYIRVKESIANNVDMLKQLLREWHMANNPLEIYYELLDPIETPLDKSIALKVYNEKTYVSFENSISGASSFKAPVDTTATITRLNKENRALEEENKTLRQDFESTTLVLTDSDLELVKQNVDIDFRLMEVEFALDIPQAILSSNINFKKKGEVKSMARTPYAMMKIVILSGDYDREDYIHKVGKYYERGRMTKEEYDELMSLMTADEVISK